MPTIADPSWLSGAAELPERRNIGPKTHKAR